MSKSNKKYPRAGQKSFPWIPTILGLFLIVLAILSLASPKSEGNERDFSSVVLAEVSFAAPELSLQNINGQTASLTDYRDDVVLVNNWATWKSENQPLYTGGFSHLILEFLE